MINVKIVAVGSELLIGDILDSNSNFIAKHLNKNGIKVKRISQISDDKDEIVEELYNYKKVNTLIFTGGLGPTNDDITKEVVTDYFKLNTYFDEKIFSDIKQRFAKRNITFSDTNKSQAIIPESSEKIRINVINNRKGTAPGIHFDIVDSESVKNIFLLPGVPYEMEDMLLSYVIPFLIKVNNYTILTEEYYTRDISESKLFEKIDVENIEKYCSISFLPQSFGVKIRLKSESYDNREAVNNLNKAESILLEDVDRYVALKGKNAAMYLFGLLKEYNLKICFAESCTGGLAAKTLTEIPGSSAVFEESYITYSNESKFRILTVNPHILSTFGAVSEETVEEMLQGLLAISKADIVGAVSGIAGPEGGSKEKPVGTVITGCANVKGEMSVIRNLFNGNREYIRKKSVDKLFFMMIDMLKNRLPVMSLLFLLV